MSKTSHQLPFERPIYEIELKIEQLEAQPDRGQAQLDDVRRLRRELSDLKKKIFSQLTPWESVQVARHPERPLTTDYLSLVFDEFVELHGDKCFGDDRALRSGFAKLDQYKVMVIGHQKGKTLKER